MTTMLYHFYKPILTFWNLEYDSAKLRLMVSQSKQAKLKVRFDLLVSGIHMLQM